MTASDSNCDDTSRVNAVNENTMFKLRKCLLHVALVLDLFDIARCCTTYVGKNFVAGNITVETRFSSNIMSSISE
jgi:hypothetical protein